MQKARALVFVLAAMVMSVGIAEGMTITEVKIAQAIPVTLSYASGSGVLTYDENEGAEAQVTFDDDSIEIFTSVDISSSHTLTADTSSGGLASGEFDTGSISVQISGPLGINPGSDVTSITLAGYFDGDMDWFELQANNGLPNPTLNGTGVFTLTTNNVVSNSGIIWDATWILGAVRSVIITTHHSLVPASPADLSGDISSTSGSLVVWAYPFVPEPLTLALLGLGGVAVLRRRR